MYDISSDMDVTSRSIFIDDLFDNPIYQKYKQELIDAALDPPDKKQLAFQRVGSVVGGVITAVLVTVAAKYELQHFSLDPIEHLHAAKEYIGHITG